MVFESRKPLWRDISDIHRSQRVAWRMIILGVPRQNVGNLQVGEVAVVVRIISSPCSRELDIGGQPVLVCVKDAHGMLPHGYDWERELDDVVCLANEAV